MADPNPYFQYLEDSSDKSALFDRPIEPEEPSSFLIETQKSMTAYEVQARLLEAIARSFRVTRDTLFVETLIPGSPDEPAVHFLVDFMVDQFPNLLVHAQAALEFAEWLEETQAWIREARADIVWTGADTVSKFSNRIGGFCSAGKPRDGHDWQWGYKRVRAADALAYSQAGKSVGGHGIRIGHIDTGFSSHIEVDGTYNPNSGFDLILKRLPAKDPMNYLGTAGHGGSTASVMVSKTSHQVTGTAPSATTVPYRAIKHVAVITKMGRVAQAIYMATSEKCDVISMSLGGLSLSNGLEAALKYAVAHDVIVVAAAGNCVGITVAPASSRNCIAVSGSRPDDKPWKYASWDSNDRVDISAPAQWVLAAAPSKGPKVYSDRGEGTSYATAMTSGAAALWLAYHGRPNCIAAARNCGLSLHEYFRRLLRHTADRPQGWNTHYGEGILDCLALLQAKLPSDLNDPMSKTLIAGPDPQTMPDKRRFEQMVQRYNEGWIVPDSDS